MDREARICEPPWVWDSEGGSRTVVAFANVHGESTERIARLAFASLHRYGIVRVARGLVVAFAFANVHGVLTEWIARLAFASLHGYGIVRMVRGLVVIESGYRTFILEFARVCGMLSQ
jgi:hypothetical protein